MIYGKSNIYGTVQKEFMPASKKVSRGSNSQNGQKKRPKWRSSFEMHLGEAHIKADLIGTQLEEKI